MSGQVRPKPGGAGDLTPDQFRHFMDLGSTNTAGRWYRIARNEASKAATVWIYGVIGDSWFEDSVPATQFVRDLAEVDAEQIDFRIHSPGGDVFDGLAIANAIRTHPARTVAYVDGLAASAASYIAVAADETVMAVGSELMLHDAWGIAMGNAADMAKMASELDHLSANLADLYSRKAGGTADEWRGVMRDETWFNATEAVDAGLADRVDEKPAEKPEAKARFDLKAFAFRYPGRAQAPAPRIPRAAARVKPPAPPVETHSEKGASSMDELIKGLRAQLGIPEDAELTDGALLAAVEEALSERAEPVNKVPDGAVLIDQQVLADLQSAAQAGRAARDEQVAEHRARLLRAAINDGRIPEARRDHWLEQLTADPEGIGAVIAGLPKGLVPVDGERGYGISDEVAGQDQAMLKAAGWV